MASKTTGAMMLATCLVCNAFNAFCGTTTYSFDWYRNAAQTDFQVPLVLEEGYNRFTYSTTAANGADIRVTDAGGSSLPIEIENWNPAGKSIVWVKVPSFSNATVLTILWGEESAGISKPDENLWGDAKLVMHLTDGADSSSFCSEFTRTEDATEDGPVASACVFGTVDRRYVCSAMNKNQVGALTNCFTISFWLNSANGGAVNGGPANEYVFQGMMKPTGQFAVLHGYKTGCLELFFANYLTGTDPRSYSDIPILDGWHHYAWTYDGTRLKTFRDGSQCRSTPMVFTMKTSTDDHAFNVGGVSTYFFSGALDELRIESVARPQSWIAAACETQARSLNKTTIPFSDYTGETLTNFPAYVHVDKNTGVDPSLLYSALTNGTAQVRDLRTDTLLPVEIEYAFANAFDNSLGLWVKMPNYSASDGVVITMPFDSYVPDGAPSYGNMIDPGAVWSSDDFLLVFHMNPTGYLYDVKSHVRLTPAVRNKEGESAGGYPVATDGPTGPYQAYRSTTNAIQSASVTIARAITNVYTISWWAKTDDDEFATPKPETYLWTILGTSALKGSNYSGSGADANRIAIWQGVSGASLDMPDANWHQYVFTFDGVKTHCYRDGVLAKDPLSGGRSFGFPSEISAKPIYLMGSNNAVKDAFRGCADEVRLETVCRSADWIRAAYLNQFAWRNGTPWQFAPHFADAVSASVEDGGALTAHATLSCRTNAAVTAYWGRTDGGTEPSAWANAITLGARADGTVAASVTLPTAGVRYAIRFRAVNEFGEAWSRVQYASAHVADNRGAEARITVNYTGGETLVDFPLCVRIPASNGLPINPAKVRILNANGTELPWEVETWNPSGESVLWVRVPLLTDGTTLTLKFHDVYPDDDGVWSADTVWSPDEYAGVWHFASSAKSGITTEDSTSFGANVTENSRKAYVTNGVAGMAFHFPTNTIGLLRSDAGGTPFCDFSAGFTFSFWAMIPDRPTKDARTWDGTADWQDFVKHELVGLPVGYVQYVIRYDAAAEGTVDFFPYCNDNRILPTGAANTYISADRSIWTNTANAVSAVCRAAKPDTGWHHYAFAHDGLFLSAYLDGMLVKREFWPFVLNTAVQGTKSMRTGFGSNTYAAKVAKGSLDEYRAERVGRSAAWIKACYDNMKPGSTFVTIGNTSYPATLIIFR